MSNSGLTLPHPPALPANALSSVVRRWQKRLRRTALVLFCVCLGIATLLTALDGGGFHVKLTYGLCIGICCTLVNDLSWFAQAWAYDKLRSLRGLPPTPGPYLSGWAGTLPSAALCVLIGPTLGQTIADAIFGFSSPSLLNLDSTAARVTLVISGLATLVLILAVSAAERVSAARAEAEAARRQAAETQLRLLQSQLEPHMLFNTLANLRVLIGLDTVRAQAMLDHLIAFLRATLQASRRGEHPLADEFARLADYLALMTVRMGPRLQVRLDLPTELNAVPVPPLLLQPLVENCIQHGLEPKVEGGSVHVSARRDGPFLVLTVQDSGIGRGGAAVQAAGRAASLPGQAAGGFGLTGVRERLATLYGERAGLSLADGPQGRGTLVTVRLPIVPVPSAHAAPVSTGPTPNPSNTTTS